MVSTSAVEIGNDEGEIERLKQELEQSKEEIRKLKENSNQSEEDIRKSNDGDSESEEEVEELDIERYVYYLLFYDMKEEFVSFMNAGLQERLSIDRFPYEKILRRLLYRACGTGAVRCAAALLNGEIPRNPSFLDTINIPLQIGVYVPIHSAAFACSPSVTELLLYHGSGTCSVKFEYDFESSMPPHRNLKLPLDLTLSVLRRNQKLWYWTPNMSIFELVIALCLPEMQDALETIELLAWHTKDTEKQFVRYARWGSIASVAAMLIAAREKLTDAIMSVRDECWAKERKLSKYENFTGRVLATLDYKREVRMRLLELFEIFDRAGNEIEAYVKREKINITAEQVVADVKDLLHRAGFDLTNQTIDIKNPEDLFFDLMNSKDSGEKTRTLLECRPPPADINMPHYSFTGLRWTKERVTNMREVIAQPKTATPTSSAQSSSTGITSKSYGGFSFDDFRVSRADPLMSFPYRKKNLMFRKSPGRPWCLVLSAVGRVLRRF